jgi:hypothetical protein
MGSDPRNEMKSNSGKAFARKVPGILRSFWATMLMNQAESGLNGLILVLLAQKRSKDESDLGTS